MVIGKGVFVIFIIALILLGASIAINMLSKNLDKDKNINEQENNEANSQASVNLVINPTVNANG